ncbi:MAG: Na(+)-translocating NADH-quinone reductase subunit C [Vicinamibacterales bacterium]
MSASRSGARYTLLFSAIVCVVCAVLVSSAAVILRDRQDTNSELDRRRNVLRAAGVLGETETVSAEEVERRFASFTAVAVDLRTGEEDPSFDVSGYDARRAVASPDLSRAVEPNPAQVTRVAHHAVVYKQLDPDGRLSLLVLPIEGKGLWSTMYGFLALGADLNTVRGLAFYQHGETPGLGGEVDSARWKALWPGREVFDDEGDVAIQVIRGSAGPPEQDPHRVDGLSGATLTSRGVSAMLRFWLGPQGFGPYLDQLRKEARGDQGA